MTQTITSAKTSRNQIPALHKKVVGSLMRYNLDYGGGKWDKASNFLLENNTLNFVYDPFNRSQRHNNRALKRISGFDHHGTDFSVTLANVLNVIEMSSDRYGVLTHIRSFAPKVIFVSCYRGKGSVSGPTRDGWQLNKPLFFYLVSIKSVFSEDKWNVTINKSKGYIKVERR